MIPMYIWQLMGCSSAEVPPDWRISYTEVGVSQRRTTTYWLHIHKDVVVQQSSQASGRKSRWTPRNDWGQIEQWPVIALPSKTASLPEWKSDNSRTQRALRISIEDFSEMDCATEEYAPIAAIMPAFCWNSELSPNARWEVIRNTSFWRIPRKMNCLQAPHKIWLSQGI